MIWSITVILVILALLILVTHVVTVSWLAPALLLCAIGVVVYGMIKK